MIHYVSFRKLAPNHRTIRIQFAIRAISKQEARTIAEREMGLHGYLYAGCD